MKGYGRAYKRIVMLGLPILVGQLGMIATGFADNAMVGHYSTDALASAAFVNNVFNVVIFTSIGFAYGLTPLVGALFTGGKHDSIGRLLSNGLVINMLYTLLLTAAMTVVYFNIDRLGQPEHLLPYIKPYYILALAGMLPIALFNTFAQWFYAINSTKMPMWIVLACNLINVAGNYLLIYGHCGCPELGLTGAGIATLIARWFGPLSIFVVFLTVRRYRPYNPGFRAGRPDMKTQREIFRKSLPVSMQMCFESASFSIAAVMTGWLGHIELAAFQIIVIVGSLGFCVYYSMAAAVSVLVANAKGDGDVKLMRRVAFAGYHVILLLAILASLTFIFFTRPMISIFTDDPAVAAMTASVVVPLVLYQMMDATQINFANALRGTGNVMPMMWVSLFAYILIGIPATYVCGFTLGLGLYGIILSFSVSLLCSASGFLVFFMRTLKADS